VPIVGFGAADEHASVSAGDDVVVRQKDARDYARILWRRKWYIVLAVVIAVGGLVGEFRLHQRQYQANAAVLTQAPSSGPVDQTVVATEIGILQSSAVEAIVAKHIDDPGTISASQEGLSGILEVSATSTSPTLAARQANAWAAAYVAYSRSLAQNQALGSTAEIQRQIQSLQQQISSLNVQIAFGGPTSNAEATNIALRNALLGQQVSLQSQLQQAQQAAAADTLVPTVVAPATVPTDPIGSSVVRAVLTGIGVGLLLGVLLVFLFEYFDDSITTREDLEAELSGQVVVIGAIPEFARRRNDVAGVVARGDVRSSAVEAYRTVRTTLQFVGMDGEGNVVQLVAPTRGEGSTTTAANLAVLMARAGRRVVLVDADLRHPRLHELFGVANRIGLTSLLIGDAATVEALQPVPELESLVVMPVGPLPPNPSELLASPQFGEVIGRLRDSGVTVIIDSPPVLEASDGMVVAAASNATVLVTSVRTGSRRRLRRALTLLDRAGTPYVGVVLNRTGKEGVVIETPRGKPEDKRRTGWLASDDLDAAHPTGDADLLHENGAGKIGVDRVQ
jgi:capsular exopolysaccharide synthesis family protein